MPEIAITFTTWYTDDDNQRVYLGPVTLLAKYYEKDGWTGTLDNLFKYFYTTMKPKLISCIAYENEVTPVRIAEVLFNLNLNSFMMKPNEVVTDGA